MDQNYQSMMEAIAKAQQAQQSQMSFLNALSGMGLFFILLNIAFFIWVIYWMIHTLKVSRRQKYLIDVQTRMMEKFYKSKGAEIDFNDIDRDIKISEDN